MKCEEGEKCKICERSVIKSTISNICGDCLKRFSLLEKERSGVLAIMTGKRKKQAYAEITNERLLVHDRELMFDNLEVRCEHADMYRRDKELRELFLAHVMWMYTTGKRVPDKYMKLGQAWGGDAEFWVKRFGKKRRIEYTVGGTSRPAWLAWRVMAAFKKGIRIKKIRGVKA